MCTPCSQKSKLLAVTDKAIRLYDTSQNSYPFRSINFLGVPELCSITSLDSSLRLAISFRHNAINVYNEAGKQVSSIENCLKLEPSHICLTDQILTVSSREESVIYDTSSFSEVFRSPATRFHNTSIVAGSFHDHQSRDVTLPLVIIAGFAPDADLVLRDPRSKTGWTRRGVVTGLKSQIQAMALRNSVLAVACKDEVVVFDLNVRLLLDESPHRLTLFSFDKFVSGFAIKGLDVSCSAKRVLMYSDDRVIIIDIDSHRLIFDHHSPAVISGCCLRSDGNEVYVAHRTTISIMKVD
ncbi:hypothetical protein GEMRC1_002762 [Eukaryota sp. GEM-RC1]